MSAFAALLAIPIAILGLHLFKKLSAKGKMKALSGGLMALNGGVVIFAVILLLNAFPATGQEAAEASTEEAALEESGQDQSASGRALGAALATGLATIGAGIAVGITGSAAIGGITQKPEILGRSLIFVGLAEGIAIYGLIISFMILSGAFGG
jgi:V/A-type H+-transporting ATPase subunit K